METPTSEFEIKTYQKKVGLWKDRIVDERLGYEIRNGEKYLFTLKDGSALEIFDFKLKREGFPYRDSHFLLAERDNIVVGFLFVGIKYRLTGEVSEASSNIGTLVRGKGVGGKLELIKRYLLQKMANEEGDIENVLDDENSHLINKELEVIKQEYLDKGDKKSFKKKLGNLFMNRQYWLSLYGKEGRGGYADNQDRERSRTYRQGRDLPVLDCLIETNDSDLRLEMAKIE